LYWPDSLTWMILKTKEYLIACSTVITAIAVYVGCRIFAGKKRYSFDNFPWKCFNTQQLMTRFLTILNSFSIIYFHSFLILNNNPLKMSNMFYVLCQIDSLRKLGIIALNINTNSYYLTISNNLSIIFTFLSQLEWNFNFPRFCFNFIDKMVSKSY
jgi:hypothetical protein